LLLLVIARLLLGLKDVNYDIANAKTEALSACTSVENIGSAMASMPHYLADGVNALAADGVTQALSGLMDMLMLSVTGVEEIVLFVINMYTSMYVCLITFAVSASLEAAIEMIEKVGQAMNESITSITNDMAAGLASFDSAVQKFLSAINIGGILGSSQAPPAPDLSGFITQLTNIKIDPSTMDADLTKLNNSIPNFAQVHNATNYAISYPFEEVKSLLNSSLGKYTFDKSVFPVPEKKALTFCSDDPKIDEFFDGLVKVVYEAKKIFISVLTVLAILAMIPMALLEIRRWHTMRQRSILLKKYAFDPMDVIYIASRPYTAGVGITLASRFKTIKSQSLVRWFIAYATSLPALFVLALGLAGLLSCLCQYTVLKAIEREVPVLAEEIGDFGATVVAALNNASEEWANSANGVIKTTNDKVNDDMFGWVNITTEALNNTLNTIVDDTTTVLNQTFGGTILYQPIMEVLNCLVGLKIAGIEKGLTWVHDNAHVTFPEFRADVFSLGAATSLTNSTTDPTASFLSSPGSVASGDITNAVVKVTNKLQSAIQQEAIISACVVLVWAVIMLCGLTYVLIAAMRRDKTRGEGGPVGYTGDNRAPLSPRSPNRNDVSNFPDFGGPVSSVHPMTSSEDVWATGGLVDEKYGDVGHRSVDASVKPGHERASSYGYMDNGYGDVKR